MSAKLEELVDNFAPTRYALCDEFRGIVEMTTPTKHYVDAIIDALIEYERAVPHYQATRVIVALKKAGFVIVPRNASDEMCGMGDDMAEAGAPISHIWEAMIDVALEERAK